MEPDDLTPDAFARLTALEQSQELLRRAQFLDASSRARHTQALDRHADHLRHLDRLVDEQVQLLAQVIDLQARMDARQDDHAARMDDHAQRMARLEEISARVQLTLDAVLAMLRHRNGH